MGNFTDRLGSTLGKFKDFLKIFVYNRKGIVGLLILVIFGSIVVFAPLLTPYDPIESKYLAGKNAAPILLTYLPPELGGIATWSENVWVVDEPGFETPQSLDEWNITTNPKVSIQHNSTVGYPYGLPGSVAISFERQKTGTTYGKNTVTLCREFYFGHNGRPKKFQGNIAILINGTSEKKWERIWNETVQEWGEGWVHYYDVPVKISVFLERVGLNQTEHWHIWPQPETKVFRRVREEWIISKESPESPSTFIESTWYEVRWSPQFGGADPIRTIFNATPGTYRYGIEITFIDYELNKKVDSTVHLDDFELQLYGTAFGLLGTDNQGRDLFSQLIYGARISLYIGLLTSILSVSIGLIVGLSAGYLGRFADEILMRFSDMLLVLPTLPLLIILIAVMGAKIEILILLIGLLGWMGFARQVRSQVLSLRERPFIEAAKAIGAGRTHILLRHILPNVMSLVYVSLATSVPGAIVAEAALSWLGFYDPTRISWGRMLYSFQFEAGAIRNWWWVIPPGLCIAAMAVSFIMLGFALDEILNPRLRMRR